MSDDENTSTSDRKVLSPPPISAEKWWELKETELWDKISKRTWKFAAATFTVVLGLITVFGFLVAAYINSQIKDEIEQEKKTFAKLREEIGREQAGIYADEKIFFILLLKYRRERQIMSTLVLNAIAEINQSDALNSADMMELKKLIVDGVNRMGIQAMRGLSRCPRLFHI
jgi:hypothetical protein